MKRPEKTKLRYQYAEELLKSDELIPNKTAARILIAEHPKLFGSLEIARDFIRRITGNHGVKQRHAYQNSSGYNFRQPFTGEVMPIPTPFWDTTPFVFDIENCLMIADNHIPFHEEGAIEITVKEAKRKGMKNVVILGDFIDHYQESDFCKQPDVSTLKQELRDGKQALQWLRKQFPKGRIIYKEGNHEERFSIKVHKAIPEVGDLLDNFTYKKLGINYIEDGKKKEGELGIELVNDRRRIDMGYLTAIHGHELEFIPQLY